MTRLGRRPAALPQVGVFWPNTSISLSFVSVYCVPCFLWLVWGHRHHQSPTSFCSEVGVPWA